MFAGRQYQNHSVALRPGRRPSRLPDRSTTHEEARNEIMQTLRDLLGTEFRRIRHPSVPVSMRAAWSLG